MRGALPGAHLGLGAPGLIPADAGSTSRSVPLSPHSRAHPRRCGEHRIGPPRLTRRKGSSPQMRGARALSLDGHRPGGLIPADAGSTSSSASIPPATRAHPRRCGEHDKVGVRTMRDVGSSPQMRGARGDCFARRLGCGLIPADAGSTAPCAGPRRHPWAHPRRCGEHTATRCLVGTPCGSSPQMRGARRPTVAVSPRSGLIPADAGSTSRCDPTRRPLRAHPRRCGEHQRPGLVVWPGCGSSPQMRGAHREVLGQDRGSGLIPADAGSTVVGSAETTDYGAHPRRCGEHRPSGHDRPRFPGSSPQMRGAPGRSDSRPSGTRAHPRRCGEHPPEVAPEAAREGSSPQMRGARLIGHGRQCGLGLIPADAGST